MSTFSLIQIRNFASDAGFEATPTDFFSNTTNNKDSFSFKAYN
jgi:hypothetical protein